MAYARFVEGSDVYVYLASGEQTLVCVRCSLRPGEAPVFYARTTAQMIDHLNKHRAAGQLVPDDAYSTLRRDQVENDARRAAQTRSTDLLHGGERKHLGEGHRTAMLWFDGPE